jgi:WD40 repeat protein
VDTGRELPRLDIEKAESLRFSADGTFLAATSDRDIVLWRQDQSSRPVFRYQPIGEVVTSLALSPDAGAVRYLRQNGTSVISLDLKPVTHVDGRTAAVVQRGPGGPDVQLIDTRSGRAVAALPDRSCPPFPGPPFSDEASGTEEEEPVECSEMMAFSPDGRRFAYVRVWGEAAPRQRITVWDTAAHHPVATLDAGSIPAGEATNEITGLAFGADGRTLLVRRSVPPTVERWDLSTGRRTSSQPDVSGAVLAVRPDGNVVVSTDNEIVDLRAKRVRPLMLGDGDYLAAGTFSQDGTRLAVGDATGRITVWDGDLRHRLGVFNGTYTGDRETEQDPVQALAFSPDGRTLAVAGASGSIQLWDVASRRRLGSRLPTSGQAVYDITFSGDGATLYVSGPWAPAERIDLDADRLVRRVCARVDSGLSPSDWRTYLPDVPYRRTC